MVEGTRAAESNSEKTTGEKGGMPLERRWWCNNENQRERKKRPTILKSKKA